MTNKEKKEILCSFSKIEGRIKELENELEVLWSKSTNVSPNISGMPKGSSGKSQVEAAAEQIERSTGLINKERNELEAIKYRIMTATSELPDITERRVIYLKYIGVAKKRYHQTMPLWKIANELGYSVDRIKHIHSKALHHLQL